MNNLEKINELAGTSESKEQIIRWAYESRILFDSLHLEEGFECMEKSAKVFSKTIVYSETLTEFDLWDGFLEAEHIDQQKSLQ